MSDENGVVAERAPRRAHTKFAAVLGASLLLFLGQDAAHAATMTVTSTADALDVNPGDGVCDDGAGNCPLRAAVMETNAVAGADTIFLPAGTYRLSISGYEDAGAAGDIDVIDDLTMNGDALMATIIDGNADDRVFQIHSGFTAEINHVTVTPELCGAREGYHESDDYRLDRRCCGYRRTPTSACVHAQGGPG